MSIMFQSFASYGYRLYGIVVNVRRGIWPPTLSQVRRSYLYSILGNLFTIVFQCTQA